MRKHTLLIIIASLSLLLLPISVQAQGYGHGGGHHGGGGNGGGHGGGNNGNTYFDAANIYTFSGTIQQQNGFYRQHGAMNNTGGGMNYLFTSNSGNTFYLMTGPFWYLEQNGIELEAGQNLTVTGSVVPPHSNAYNSHDYIMVTTMTVNGQEIELRDSTGIPVWTGNYGSGYYICPNYDQNSFQQIRGTVVQYRTRTNGPNADIGSELIIRSRQGKEYRVFLAPQYHIEEIGLAARHGDTILLFGSMVNNGQDIVAQRLRINGGKLFRMRQPNGRARWTY